MIFRRKLKKDIKNFSMANLTCFNVGQGFSLANVWKSFSLAGVMFLFFPLFTIYCLLPTAVNAFEPGFPKLVWEKEFPFEIDEVMMADESGDVLLSNKSSAQLILIDPQGYERLHLGPTLNGLIQSINISADGSKIMYQNADNTPYRNRGLNIFRTYLITRNGQKIWEKDLPAGALLSPNGNWYVLSDTEISGYDLTQKLLWKKKIALNKMGNVYDECAENFSLDGQYVVTMDLNCIDSINLQEIRIHTYDYEGILKWDTTFKSDKFGYSGKSEITKEGYFIWNYKDYNSITDCLGNKVIEIPQGVIKAFIAPDAKAVLFQNDTVFQVLSLPDKILKMEKKFNFIYANLSNEGKYLVGIAKQTKEISENIIILDTENNNIYKLKIDGDFSDKYGKKCAQLDGSSFIIFKNNGQYLLIVEKKRKQNYTHLYYYQLY